MKKFIGLFVVLIIAFSLSAQKARKYNSEDTVSRPIISIKKDTIDFGSLAKQSDGITFFDIENKGNANLILKECIGSCSCTIAQCSNVIILPGETKKLKVTHETFNPGPFNNTIVVVSNDDKKPRIVLRAQGEVYDPVPLPMGDMMRMMTPPQ